ncbi:putative apicomplexan-specific [Cryptosporidium bovis]|uniref:putative apicomplexan-specific n=1 Tax=Cryptosporidium bovis TaxID=310047 RepID=UPI00351A5F86|nr:putative apicomplexan-specific [Cryptosporidium bovis]
MKEACTEKYQGMQSNWGETILAEAKQKGPILFSGTDWVVVPLDSLSPSRRSIIHPISQRLAVVENTALVDGLFGRIWEFPKCENVRERKVTRGDQFVGDSRIDFQWNKTERTLCRVCGKHILKQKFATEHYQRSPTCWRLVMKHIGIIDFDSNQGLVGGSPSPKNTVSYKTEEAVVSYKSSKNGNVGANSPSLCSTSLLPHSSSTATSSSSSPPYSPVSPRQTVRDKKQAFSAEQLGGGVQDTGTTRIPVSGFLAADNSNVNSTEAISGVYIPTSNVEYILQDKSMNMFRTATKRVYEELMKFRGSGGTGINFNMKDIDEDSIELGIESSSKFDSGIVENIMGETRNIETRNQDEIVGNVSNGDGSVIDVNRNDLLLLGNSDTDNGDNNNIEFSNRDEKNGFLSRNFLRFPGIHGSEEPYLLISSILPNVFPSISHRPLPVNVCYIKLTFNWHGARLVRDLWALDCELLVDWGDGVLTQARRFTLRELGEPPEADNEMRNIYSQGFAYLKCFVPHKPPGRADIKIRIPKSLWEYWEAFSNDKNNVVMFHSPQVFASNQIGNVVFDSSNSNNICVGLNVVNKIHNNDNMNNSGIVGPISEGNGSGYVNQNRKAVPYSSKNTGGKKIDTSFDNVCKNHNASNCSCQNVVDKRMLNRE